MKKVIFIAIGVIVLLGAVGLISGYFYYNNTEISLRAEVEAQKQKVEGMHDKMWKTIQQKAQVSDEYKNAFSEVYPDIMAGRYSGEGDGSLMKWVTEQNPNFDTALYVDLSQSIELLRTEFQNSQELMIDKAREHEVLCTTYPGIWFIKNAEPIEYVVISSTTTKIVVETGVDDNVDVFNK